MDEAIAGDLVYVQESTDCSRVDHELDVWKVLVDRLEPEDVGLVLTGGREVVRGERCCQQESQNRREIIFWEAAPKPRVCVWPGAGRM